MIPDSKCTNIAAQFLIFLFSLSLRPFFSARTKHFSREFQSSPAKKIQTQSEKRAAKRNFSSQGIVSKSEQSRARKMDENVKIIERKRKIDPVGVARCRLLILAGSRARTLSKKIAASERIERARAREHFATRLFSYFNELHQLEAFGSGDVKEFKF